MLGFLKNTLELAQAVNPQLARRTEVQRVTLSRTSTREEAREEEEAEASAVLEAKITAAFIIGRLDAHK